MKQDNWLAQSLGTLIILSPLVPLCAHAAEAEKCLNTIDSELSKKQACIGNSQRKFAPLDSQFPSSISQSPNPPILANIQTADSQFLTDSLDAEEEPMEQVTSVEQLSDVQPTDWAYQALKSLVERYGINLGYPDNTFRGNKPMTRYEFAAVLAQVLEKFQLPTAAEGETIREDVETLQRLQKEFAEALAKLSDRADKLTARADILTENQFSVTSKLKGQFILTAATGTASPIVARQRLNLLSSWTSGEVLVTQLEMGNNARDSVSRGQNEGANLLGSNGELAGAGGLDYVEVDNEVQLSKLYYTFKPISNLAVTIGAKMAPRDFIDRNRFANDEAVDFNSSFFLNNPLIVQNQIDRPGGAGVAANWELKGTPFTVNGLYIAADAGDSGDGGFFGDRYQASVELKYSTDRKWAVRVQYTNASINNTDINAFGINGEWAYNRTLGVFGRLGVSSYEGFNAAIAADIDAHPWTWALGVTVRNFFIPGTLAGIGIGQPFITGKVGDAPQTNVEAFYNLLVSDNLSLTPSLILVTNADNDSENGTTFEFALRSAFSF